MDLTVEPSAYTHGQRNENLFLSRNLYISAYSSFIHNSQNLKTTQMSFYNWMVQQSALHSMIKKEQTIDAGKNWMILKDCAERKNSPTRVRTTWFRLCNTRAMT